MSVALALNHPRASMLESCRATSSTINPSVSSSFRAAHAGSHARKSFNQPMNFIRSCLHYQITAALEIHPRVFAALVPRTNGCDLAEVNELTVAVTGESVHVQSPRCAASQLGPTS